MCIWDAVVALAQEVQGARGAWGAPEVWGPWRGKRRGQSMIEYALIFLLVILGLIFVLVIFGPQMAAIYRDISNNL